MTKVQLLIKAVNQMAKELDATDGNLGYTFKIKTKVGNYIFRAFHEPDEKRVKIYSIVGRFEDVDRAKEMFDCNPHSGKHNFHYREMDDCLDFFQQFLENATDKELSREYSGH